MSSRIRRSLKLSLFVLLLLPLAAILLEAHPSSGGANKIDACSFLTKAEIQEVLGKPVKDGKLSTSANPAAGNFCAYVVGDNGAFSLLVKSLGPGEAQTRILDVFSKSKMKTAAAPGIGDLSFFSFPGNGMVQLYTYKGTKYIIMTLLVPGLSEDDEKVPAEKLMKKILPKL
jgi:hypothetical protein